MHAFKFYSAYIEDTVSGCNAHLDVITLQIVATSSFHSANGCSLSADHIYGPARLPATNAYIHTKETKSAF